MSSSLSFGRWVQAFLLEEKISSSLFQRQYCCVHFIKWTQTVLPIIWTWLLDFIFCTNKHYTTNIYTHIHTHTYTHTHTHWKGIRWTEFNSWPRLFTFHIASLQDSNTSPPMNVLDMTLNNLMARLQQCWSFGKCRIWLHCHRFQVHTGREW